MVEVTEPMLSNVLPQKKILFCNHCKTDTNHICHSEYVRDRESHEPFWEEKRYRLWVCAGCEYATLEVLDEDAFRYSEGGWDGDFFPKREENDLIVKSFMKLPEKLNTIYRETIQSFNSGLKLLCSVGLRALIEGICDDRGIKGRNLEVKIDNLKDILPANIVTNIHNFRFIGNTAIHELTPPENRTLRLAIEIVEDLLNFLYELNYKASELALYRRTGSTRKSDPPPKKAG